MSILRTVLAWFGRIALWTVIIGCAAVLAVAVVIPRVAGATPYTILTGSMRPTLPPGTLVVVRPVPMTRIGVGSVITYQLRSGQPAVVTHRVVEQGISAQQEILFRTRGDANDTVDQGWVRPVQIKGTLWYAVPYLGYPAQLLNRRQHQYLSHLAAAALVIYAGCMFGSALQDRRRARRAAAGTAAEVSS